jgi:excisionase family DNA binding protein
MSKLQVEDGRLGYSLERLAELLDVSTGFLRKQMREGKLKGKKLGRRVVILRGEVERYLGEVRKDA